MRFFSAQGKENDAVAAARQVVAADSGNLEAARMVARSSLKSGDLASTFSNFALVLRKEPGDAEALNVIGRYAYSAYDINKFRAVLKRLAGLPPAAASIHEPDLIVATGRIDTAVDRYYAVEENVKDNPALALKIGRIAVMRHSTPIAELEFKRLQETDPNYGLHILKAYLAASAGVRNDADSELKAALAASRPGDDYWTNVAEINVISGNSAAVLPALQRAVERKEPTVSYILSNPLFQFLRTDPEYQKLRQKMVEQQNEIRTALAGVPL
jgi:Flp pilus assembly protein TadD